MITPAHTILNEINYINSIIKKYPYCKNLLNSRLNFLQNKINFINKYTYKGVSGSIYYNLYDNGIMNWSKEKLEKELKDLEGGNDPRNLIGGIRVDNEKALIQKILKERVLKDFIDNHLKIKYTTKIIKDDDYELIEAY